MVEFALVLLPLTLVVLGIIQLGLVVHAKIDETHLAASAARFAAVNQNPGDDQELVDFILGKADRQDIRDNAEVCVVYPDNEETGTSGEPGDPVTVTVVYDFALVPGVGGLMDPGLATINIGGSATMRLETFPTNIPEGCSA